MVDRFYVFILAGLFALCACGASDAGKASSSRSVLGAESSEVQTKEPSRHLVSWSDNESKKRIVAFVEAVSQKGSEHFVPTEERIAVFDNDGTLMSEMPMYVQLAFAIDRIKALRAEHPEWSSKMPFKAILEGETEAALAGGHESIGALIAATHSGTSPEAFSEIASSFMQTAKHAKTGRPYTQMVYQPMLELLMYLRAHGFTTYICTGGGEEFVRVFSDRVYGIPRENVIGSQMKLEYKADAKQLMRHPELARLNDGAVKPASIQHHLGRRPIAAFGNSDGDLQMLEWVTAGKGHRLAALVHHTDDAREYAYDRDSKVGKLDRALDLAEKKNWVRIDMKRDWKKIYP